MVTSFGGTSDGAAVTPSAYIQKLVPVKADTLLSFAFYCRGQVLPRRWRSLVLYGTRSLRNLTLVQQMTSVSVRQPPTQ